MARPTNLLDACVLINLLASGEFEDIAGSTEEEFGVCSAVGKETAFLRAEDTEVETQEPIVLEPLVSSGRLKVFDIESELEEELYVDYASQLDDGEAMSLAIAESRGFLLATDDRKARRLFLEATGIADHLVSTTDILRTWADRQSPSAPRLKDALLRIRHRARFSPNQNDRNFLWWQDACR
ncbi:MAG TPA: hypothetical protein VJH03_11410 [Blastocatellia bacterium]|nr:hypothetical protein [Blastocatellia bacterium]